VSEIRKIRAVIDTDCPWKSEVRDAETGEALYPIKSVSLTVERDVVHLWVELAGEMEIMGNGTVTRLRAKPDGSFEPIEEPSA
jgi:hypothetical protein